MPGTLKRLPITVEKGVTGGDTFLTNRPPPAASGHMQRTQEWDQCLYRGQISFGRQGRERALADLKKVEIHFKRCRGSYLWFPFRDWKDYQARGQYIDTGDGVKTDVQLVMRYLIDDDNDGADDEDLEYTRTIVLPVAETLVVYDNLSVVSASDYTLRPNGIVRFNSAIVTGHKITADFDFDKRVIYGVDQLNTQISMYNAGSIATLPIEEVIGEDDE